MPRNRDFKRLVRARMAKTGEAYTAARAQILKRPRASAPAPAATPSIDYAALAGKSNRTMEEKTGCSWERWVEFLDRFGAADLRHGEIAALVAQKFRIDTWWSQTIAVGYERIKGLRAPGQRSDGRYESSKSKTFDVPVATLFDAWANARRRKRWLTGEAVTVRTSIPPRSLRLGWHDGTIVAAWFLPKGAQRSTVTVAHTKLPDKAAVDRQKAYWSERLDALGQVLSTTRRSSTVRLPAQQATARG